jgi:hypothetical protein
MASTQRARRLPALLAMFAIAAAIGQQAVAGADGSTGNDHRVRSTIRPRISPGEVRTDWRHISTQSRADGPKPSVGAGLCHPMPVRRRLLAHADANTYVYAYAEHHSVSVRRRLLAHTDADADTDAVDPRACAGFWRRDRATGDSTTRRRDRVGTDQHRNRTDEPTSQ